MYVCAICVGNIRLGKVCQDLGKFDEASVWLSRALAIDENNSDVVICLGDLFARTNRWDEAKKCYEKVLQKVLFFNNMDRYVYILC